MLAGCGLSLLAALGCRVDFSWGEQLRDTGNYPFELHSLGGSCSEETLSDFLVFAEPWTSCGISFPQQ